MTKRTRSGTSTGRIDVAGVAISHGDRVIDPVSGTTKLDLARYQEAVAPYVLPYAAKRPLMLLRCPDGNGSCFVQKHGGRGLSGAKHVESTALEGEEVLSIKSATGLVELAQFNGVELHGWGCRLPRPERADWLVFDLDPDEGLAFSAVVEAAREMADALKTIGLRSFAKTTGGKGLHVVVPLGAGIEWDLARGFTKAMAETMVARAPSRYVATMSKRARQGKIFIDWLRNARGATAILPLSPRAREGAPVAMPVAWKDLGKIDPREFDVRSAPAILARRRDPWEAFFGTKQRLSKDVLEAVSPSH